MVERTILEHVHALAEGERSLRENSPGAVASERLAKIEEELDKCWDLLRQRRPTRGVGDDSEPAPPRHTGTGEGRIR